MMKKCAEVCNACQIECDSCFQHCLDLVASGKAEHKATAQLCVDGTDEFPPEFVRLKFSTISLRF
jgi:hypothetical protein